MIEQNNLSDESPALETLRQHWQDWRVLENSSSDKLC